MRILVFSDIHGNQYAFRAFLKDIGGVRYDAAIFCGDIFGYYYGQKEILDGLNNMPSLTAVRGNHDEYALMVKNGVLDANELYPKYGHSYGLMDENVLEYIDKLPKSAVIEIDGRRIGVLHASPLDFLEDRLYPKDETSEALIKAYEDFGCEIVFCGHTHFRSDRMIGSVRVINAGSVGQQRDGLGFCYGIFDTDTDEFTYHTIKYDISELEREIDLYDADLAKLKDILHRGE